MPRRVSGSTVVGVVVHLIVTVGAVVIAVAIGMLVLGLVLATADAEGQVVEIASAAGWIVGGLAAALVGAVALAVFALRDHAWARWSLIGIGHLRCRGGDRRGGDRGFTIVGAATTGAAVADHRRAAGAASRVAAQLSAAW
jgi:hypothetical protein